MFRRVAPLAAAFAATLLFAPLAEGQTAGQTAAQAQAPPRAPTSLKAESGLPRTPDGRPDFQGVVWEANFFVPLEQTVPGPAQPLVLSEQAAKATHALMTSAIANNPAIAMDPELPGLLADSKGLPIVRGERRSRLVVMPADGRIPLTPAALRETQAAMVAFAAMRADNPEERMLAERCISTGGIPPLTLISTLHPRQFTQTRDHVVIQTEYGDEARIAPFANAHGPAALKPPLGDAIARWDGDTLVVETTHFPPIERLRVSPFGSLIINADAKVIERFTRLSKDELLYQFTIEDPKVYAAPWLGEYSMFRADYRMYPSGCHEGNYGLENILAGAREEDRAAQRWLVTNGITEATAGPDQRWTIVGTGPAFGGMRAWAVLAPKNGSGEAQVALRIEHLSPTVLTGGGTTPGLSEINVFAVDCAGQRIRRLSAATYAAHNLTGAKSELPASATWLPATTRPAIASGIRLACA